MGWQASGWRRGVAWCFGEPAAAIQPARRRQRRRLLTWLTLSYLATGALLLAGVEFLSQWFWPLDLLNYAPLALGLAPGMALAAASAIWHPRLLLLLGVAGLAVVLPGYQFNPQRPLTAPTLRVMTASVGQRQPEGLVRFVRERTPDLLIEEGGAAPGRDELEQIFAAGPVTRLGEFHLYSRLPVLAAAPVPLATAPAAAARFEIQWQDHRIAVYAVHFPTPRDALLALRRHPLRWGRLASFTAEKRHMAEELARDLHREALPCVVVGDFNQPPRGRVYRLFSAWGLDAHRIAGQGFGYTCPSGVRRHWLRPLAPWMRIDYCFSSRSLRPVSCRIEPPHNGQHRDAPGKQSGSYRK